MNGRPENAQDSSSDIRVASTLPERYGDEYSAEARGIMCRTDCEVAHEFAKLLPGYAPTPFIECVALAKDCNVDAVFVKHEGSRQPTHSFKVLGPPYALARQLLARCDQSLGNGWVELTQGKLKKQLQGITCCAATSGNHGRALAWAAGLFGCHCRIYMPEATGEYRETQIRGFAAETVRVAGTYDESVLRAVHDAQKYGYILVGDGARSGSEVLRNIIHGYSVLGQELVEAFHTGAFHTGGLPTHVFIPAGGGSLAAAVAGRLWLEFGQARPKIVIVQPDAADSGYQSCLQSRRVASLGDLKTIMDGLSVRELSADAWSILGEGAFAFMTVDDDVALSALRENYQHQRLRVGETGIAALAAFTAAAKIPTVRQQLGLDNDSRVIMIATEGITDPGVIDRLLSSRPQ